MLTIRLARLFVASLTLAWVVEAPVAAQTDGWQTITTLVESIKTPSSLPVKERRGRARQFAVLIHDKTGKTAPEKLITDLAGVMSDSDQVVRFWTAGALGNLGPQAVAAIPALERAFAEAQAADPPGRARSGIHLDDVIQRAMDKITRHKK